MSTMQAGTIEQATETFSQAASLVVRSASARQLATDLFDAIRAFRKQSEAQKEEVCRPLKTAWEEAKQPFDEFKKECEQHEAALSRKMGEWDREQERMAKEAQAKIQAKIDAENAKKIAKAEEKGRDLSEVVLKVAPVVQAPAKTVETQAGTKVTRTVKKVYEPIGIPSLMKDFPQLFDINMARFNALAKTGMLDGRADVSVREEYVYQQRSN